MLAKRIEEGAAQLASFAEALSETEWATSVSATDHRPIGVIVHHVASVYPIEVEVARTIAGGTPITDVTWDVIAEMNSKHHREQTGVSKADALELLGETVARLLRPSANSLMNSWTWRHRSR